MILFVDLRHAVTGKSLHSMAVPLTLANVRKLFKADMRLVGHYDGMDVQETFLVQGVDLDLEDEEAQTFMAAGPAAGEQEEGSNARLSAIAGLRFDFTLFHRGAKTMALLGQGQADLDRRLNGYGPRFGAAAAVAGAVGAEGEEQQEVQEGRFFGEGAEFLCAVPLFAWIFASSSSSTSGAEGGEGGREGRHRVTLDALAIEVHYVDTADTSVRPQDELLECLYQIVKKELVWV
jgi:hypothetical protein